MNSGTRAAARAFAGVLALVACGGGAKPADSPGTCPEGTALKGEDCVATEPGAHASSDDESPPKRAKHDADEDGPRKGSSRGGAAANDSPPEATGKSSYDRESVEVELRRAARQVKANCGSATDGEGNMIGPWGTTKASVVLGRNGHVKQVTVPPPYDGKAVGVCIVHSFEKIQFPPYAAGSDVSVDWEVEIVQPKHK
ncbi:MAG: hypothetical protein M3O50_02730 [Myxococcota bacterium]|nr:hypothetical protein [Myxococcota bacterium]